MSRFWMILAAFLLATTVSFAQVPGSVVITEVMYDDTASTDADFVEIHNTTAAAIDISGWELQDDGTYPPPAGGEGAILVPAGTVLGANAYLILCKAALDGIAGEVVCTQFNGSFDLSNSGDNLALYSAATGGTLIDGSLTVAFPDLTVNNSGTTVEKCDPNATWSGSAAAWHASGNAYSPTGRYRFCTPGFANTPCADTTPPTISNCLPLSNLNLDILFSENLSEVTAENVNNYHVNPGAIVPDSATRDNTNNSLVHLVLNSPLPNGNYAVVVSGVQDMFGNTIVTDSCTFTINQTVNPCDVVITEIMYDDTAGTDAEWVEIHNTTNAQLDISGWVLSDDDVYPADGGEGAIQVPANTFLNAGGLAILCRVDLPGISGEIVCATISGNWALGNTGDNLALFTAPSGGQLVDGSLSVFYPEITQNNAGNSVEKCDYNSCWTGDPSAWTESQVQFAAVGQYRHCTPFDEGFCCTGPNLANIEVIQFGPPTWEYKLTHISGCINEVVFTNFCAGTTGSVTNSALSNGWTVMANGDGNDGDSIIFVAATPLSGTNSDSVMGFILTHPFCADLVNWSAGGSTGVIDGPLPVELNGFAAVAGNGNVQLSWSTGSESDLDKFELRRDNVVIERFTANNSETGANYSFTDTGLQNGTAYSYELSVYAMSGARTVLATQSATPSLNSGVVSEYALHQNFPNPFNPETSISFDLAEASVVKLSVYNVAGQEVATLADGNLSAGSHTISFDGANLTSGVYLYRLTAGEFTATMKMVLMK